jgi:uncharacterized protein (UPF0332 family)
MFSAKYAMLLKYYLHAVTHRGVGYNFFNNCPSSEKMNMKNGYIERYIEEFLSTKVNYAIVLRADLETLQCLKVQIAQCPTVDVIYQKVSGNKLRIVEANEVQ